MHAETATAAGEPAARALALMVAANGRIDDCELQRLDDLDAFRRLGVSRTRFVALAQACLAELGTRLGEQPWLGVTDLIYINLILDAVSGPRERLLVCRFAAAAITADGRVSRDERMVYDYALARWLISPDVVTQAILRDRAGAA